jgi:dGTPase
MLSARSQGRRYDEPETPYRTCYQRDRDRIIHCKAFRRLEYKTQVFLNHEGDHFRTRLTHTIEVTQISRTLARSLGLNEDLTEAIALAHDLGHTPFGHSGEAALRELMAEHGGFEHNAHGLRVVDLLERQYPRFPGLNLTAEVRQSIVKHHTRWDAPDGELWERCPALLEGQVVALADSIAYDNHDLLDGLEAGILTLEALQGVELWTEAEQAARAACGQLSEGQVCQETVRRLIDMFVTDVIESSQAEMGRRRITSWQDAVRQDDDTIRFSPGTEEKKAVLEDFLFQTLYRDYRVVRATNSAKRFVRSIFRAYVEDQRQLPPNHRQWAAEVGLHRAVCDYVAGMTDRYAQDLYIQLFHPYPRL